MTRHVLHRCAIEGCHTPCTRHHGLCWVHWHKVPPRDRAALRRAFDGGPIAVQKLHYQRLLKQAVALVEDIERKERQAGVA